MLSPPVSLSVASPPIPGCGTREGISNGLELCIPESGHESHPLFG